MELQNVTQEISSDNFTSTAESTNAVDYGTADIAKELTNSSNIDLDSNWTVTSSYDMDEADTSDIVTTIGPSDSVKFDFSDIDVDEAGGVAATIIAIVLGMLAFIIVIGLACYVYYGIVMTKLLKKADHPNTWAGWVPIYNSWTLAEISGYPGYMGLLSAALPVIPGIGGLAALIISILILDKLSKSFGKETGFTIGLVFLNPIFMGILAFGSAEYVGTYVNPEKGESKVKEAEFEEKESKKSKDTEKESDEDSF